MLSFINTDNIYELSNNIIINNYLNAYNFSSEQDLSDNLFICISFNIFDKNSNSYNTEIKIKIIYNYLIKPYINIFDTSYLLLEHDFSYNTNTNTNTNTNNDISLTFINDSSLIIMEALNPIYIIII